MSAKASKEVIDRVRSGRHLLSAYEVDGPRLAACFVEETRAHLEDGEEEPQPDGVLGAVGRKLRGSIDHLIDTDHAVADAEGWESVLRKQFKKDKRELAFCIVAFRRLVLGQYIEPDLANLGLEPVNVRDGITIVRRGELVGERFEAENLAKMLGRSWFEHPVNLGPYVAEIRKKAAALLALSNEINEAHRASDRARIARSQAKDDFDRVYLRGARIFEDLCRLCGLDELAARVRKREGRSTAEEKTPEAPEGGAENTEEENHKAPEQARGQSDAGARQPPATRPRLLSRLLRPLRSQHPGPLPEGFGGAGTEAGRPTRSGQRGYVGAVSDRVTQEGACRGEPMIEGYSTPRGRRTPPADPMPPPVCESAAVTTMVSFGHLGTSLAAREGSTHGSTSTDPDVVGA